MYTISVQLKHTNTRWSPWLLAHPFDPISFEADIDVSPRQAVVMIHSLSGAPEVFSRESKEFKDAVKDAILAKLGLPRARIHFALKGD